MGREAERKEERRNASKWKRKMWKIISRLSKA
jgi:hypothetical protein